MRAGPESVAQRLSVLCRVGGPHDLRTLRSDELGLLAAEIRQFLVEKMSASGGHLGPNLGVVELTIALHRVFESPTDPMIFDTGHQSCVHKIVTGRREGFDRLRARGGLSGYPCRAESEHDWTESSHASAALSYADGLAKSFALRGEHDRCVVAVVGDGALTGGMCWEALNNIATGVKRRIVVVVNDNGRSYGPTVGGPTEPLFTALGLDYLGPVDGHDISALEAALSQAKAAYRPVVVHTITEKGRGFPPAEADDSDRMHGRGPFDPHTGEPVGSTVAQTWTTLFAEELVVHAERRTEIVAISAAMAGPTGLAALAARFPDRVFDVGIAEQHALTSAAGLALGGLHPVVALYSTFLNRAFDQLLMDVALLNLPVTIVLDRAGITGPDGPSHHGVWDLALLAIVPRIRVAAPRDAASLRSEFAEALAISDGPTAIRYPTGAVGAPIPAVRHYNGIDVLYQPERAESDSPAGAVLLVAVGSVAAVAVAAALQSARNGVDVTVVDPRWVLPVPDALVALGRAYRLVVTVEDGLAHSGVGAAVAAKFRAADLDVPVRGIGVPAGFLEHGTRAEMLADVGLEPTAIAGDIATWLAAVDWRLGRG
ncbi:1-deoxy-D-xylulose-5-phosphate synthase [Nocardia higoensis]|uniref:1-deoxy-D-xylulose-5-phosphate synthase n=1 Tax=Nocardia higoensis TaxID=228599 RepID=UPI000314E812|nr:1-deoxy-D-xylulose-5-phosphate synthase [Nocardia higoensis]